MTDPVAWTFATGGEVSEQLDWLTDTLAAATGPIQTRRLREAPLVTLAFSGLEATTRRRWLEAQLWHVGAGPWLAPLVMDAQALAAPLASGSATVPADTAHARFVADGQALLCGDNPRDFEVLSIESVGDGELLLAEETARTWPAGTRLSPLRLATLDGQPLLGRFTSDHTDVYQVRFRLQAPLESPADFGPTTYRSLPVLDRRPVWTSDPRWSPERTLTTADHDAAPAQVFDLVGAATPRVVLQFALVGMAEVQAFRGLLYAMAGRWSPAWVPTWASDLRVVATVADGATTLDVEGPLMSEHALTSNRRDIRIELADGTVHYRRITAAVLQSPTADRLTLDTPIASGFAANQVALVSFLTLCRQESDINVLRHFDHATVQCELVLKGEVHAL
ncbi:hypothetical protein [Pseudoxanthomonas indica]|uniref:Uncharacterized protein n=1 Tax=Pseudoxanthomonas indica TaxID=428993 RepID=A0A1T5K0B0_9GAMM|nr:hypothetical protein [Pseudoxanthomonas indica]GGD45690.1 hypothetical protein GCM10007235_17030 [Pseudoxanthomonas indica]SKC57081.1 hypothetical protein SAMN06296058_1244 [Pseudoxanthomonas indica]